MNFKTLSFILLAFVLGFQSCDDDDDDTPIMEEPIEETVFQLAINEAKAGQRGAFLTTRADFVEALEEQAGVVEDVAWRPFFTTLPDVNLDNVIVGMTALEGESALQSAYGALTSQSVFTDYAATFDPQTVVGLKTLDGEDFDLSSLTQAGNVVEFAVRRATVEDAFGANRDAFFESLNNYEGFLFDREFEVYDVANDGSLTQREDYQAVVIVWEDREKFLAATTPIFASSEFANFSAGIEVETYYATELADLSRDNDVFELAVRRINDGVSITEFTAARDAFVEALAAQPGAFHDREVQPFFDFLNMGIGLDSIYIGMTQYEDLETYQRLAQELSTIPEAATFLATFSPLVFEALQPIEGYGPVDLAAVAPLGTGEVLEIAVRDLEAYDNFEQQDYETKRDAFLEKLSEQPGFVREIQWQSAINPSVVVGMTVYESQEAVIAINADTTFTGSTESIEFIGTYPPNVFGSLNTVLK